MNLERGMEDLKDVNVVRSAGSFVSEVETGHLVFSCLAVESNKSSL
jgi:hypothetical protein